MRRYIANLIFSLQLRRFLRSRQPTFRRWIELEELKDHFIRAAEEGTELPQTLARLLSAALGIYAWQLPHIDWVRQFSTFNLICLHNAPRMSLPILSIQSAKKGVRDPWDYPDRMWYLYSHIIARAYGWSLDEISQLKVDDAIAIIQEILTDEQLEREFLWGLSERAFSYDPKSKVGKFIELPRPFWMKPKVDTAVRKIRIPKAMLPVGNVNYDAVDEATKPRDVPHSPPPFPGGHVDAL